MTIKLKTAKLKHLNEVYNAFAARKDLFPHIRKDYVERQIEKGSVVSAKGVYIIYDKYKRKQHLGTTFAVKGNFILHQIVNTVEGNGMASKVFDTWIKTLDDTLYLTVRASNEPARRFYEHKGMAHVGDISWSGGDLPGAVYRLGKPYYAIMHKKEIIIDNIITKEEALAKLPSKFGDLSIVEIGGAKPKKLYRLRLGRDGLQWVKK